MEICDVALLGYPVDRESNRNLRDTDRLVTKVAQLSGSTTGTISRNDDQDDIVSGDRR